MRDSPYVDSPVLTAKFRETSRQHVWTKEVGDKEREFLYSVCSELSNGRGAIWINPAPRTLQEASGLSGAVVKARDRFARFAPVLAQLFPDMGSDGAIRSPLLLWPGEFPKVGRLYIKADHALPITGSIKARGGVHELLAYLELIGELENLTVSGGEMGPLSSPRAREVFSRYRVVVASTGNLGFSIGVVARAFGVSAEIHMSADAKAWKKTRLQALGATVIEHSGDYGDAVNAARISAEKSPNCHFIDDERSQDLFVGYATAGAELADQLEAANIEISLSEPLTVYVPCGVGGAPGGVLFGLRSIFGAAVRCVFVEPVASACMLLAIAENSRRSVSVYDYGFNNVTIADGLAVARASEFVLDTVGDAIDAAVAVPDQELLRWVKRAYDEAALQLEPAAAAAFAGIAPYIERTGSEGLRGTHVAWTTGGSLMPHGEFSSLLSAAAPIQSQ